MKNSSDNGLKVQRKIFLLFENLSNESNTWRALQPREFSEEIFFNVGTKGYIRLSNERNSSLRISFTGSGHKLNFSFGINMKTI